MKVLYEDNHIIAVFKPANLLTQGDSTGDETLMDRTKNWIREKHKKPGNVFLGLVHRLDRPVSGVVVFAKTSKAASRLTEQFRNRSVKKIYWALVEGYPNPKKQTLRHFIKDTTHKSARVSTSPVPGSKEAILHFSVLRCASKQALLEVQLETGRKHQIRAQLSFIGHPVIGDRKYGSKVLSESREIALSARSIEITHPVRKDRIKFEAPCFTEVAQSPEKPRSST